MKKYEGRTAILHVKDMTSEGDFICPGRGVIDFAPVFKEAKNKALNTTLWSETTNLMV